ncbi:MAG: hypothetical protein K8U03_21975 [Planctomycetia bacterium]|nr:hypothetical protein [Planctomycetia bacterium]
MKFSACLAVVALSFGAAFVSAEEIKSGLAAGEGIGPFTVTKIAGAADDGVKVGDDLCYRCKYGGRPQVMVFTRKGGAEVVNLSKELNTAVTKNEAAKLAAFVNVIGSKADAEKTAKALGADSAKVPVVVPVENENGPANYGINPDAEVTVIIAKGGKVISSTGYAAGKFDAAAVAATAKAVNSAAE